MKTILTPTSDKIKVSGHRGTWYVVDTLTDTDGRELFELEHEAFGDEACHLIVNAQAEVILDDVWNGFDDYLYLTESLLGQAD